MTTLAEYKEQAEETGTWMPMLYTRVMQRWGVTTCWRESSSMLGGWYAETFVWDESVKPERQMIADATGSSHFDVINNIMENGYYKEALSDRS